MDMFESTYYRRLRNRLLPILLLCIVTVVPPLTAQERYHEEIIVSFEVPRLIKKDIFVQYDGTTIYLPLIEVFTALDINVKSDINKGHFNGEFLGENVRYDIDLTRGRTVVKGNDYVIDSSMYFLSETDLFLRIDLYKTMFDLPMKFNFSNLSVNLPLNTDFPAYQKLKRKLAHESLKKTTTALRDVRPLPRRREYLKGAVADWLFSASPVGGNRVQYFSLTMGGMLLGGDLTVSGTGNTSVGIQSDQLKYRWHYFLDRSPYITQFDVGHISTDGMLSRSMTGVKVTNRPQVQRRYFQTVHISDYIGQGWEVELYVNNRLTDYVYTDESGRYDFLVDIYYGSSQILLKFYGPNGEIKTEEQYVKVPYTLIPKNTFEYTVAGGAGNYADSEKRYLQGNGYYGVLSNLTVGVNSEMALNPEEGEKPVVAGELNLQVTGNTIVSAAFSPSNNMKYSLNFSEPSIVNLNGSFTKFFENDFYNPYGHEFNAVFSASSPLKIGSRYFGLRYYASYDKYRDQRSLSMNYGFNSGLSIFHLNYIGKYKMTDQNDRTTTSISSQLIASIRRVPLVTPQFRVDYDHSTKEITRYGVNLTKRLFRSGQLSLTLERNAISKVNMITMTFNFFSSFADFTSRALYSANQVSVNQVQRGCVVFDQESGAVRFDRRAGVGYGSAVLRPFLDDNYNGQYDQGEEYLSGLKANIKGAGGRPFGANRFYYYDRLQPYDDYIVQIDPYSLDNPLLKPVHENYKVSFSPNVVTSID
ncbi:MAG: hypothetical protein PVH24_04180, partial [Candidatus Zixiibacteriota bacterium]